MQIPFVLTFIYLFFVLLTACILPVSCLSGSALPALQQNVSTCNKELVCRICYLGLIFLSALGSQSDHSHSIFFFMFLFFPAKVKIDKDFWALASGMLEITPQCFPLMSDANVLSTAMLTLCLLFIPTRGVVLYSETLRCSDRNTRRGNQRGDQVPSVVSCVQLLKRKPLRAGSQPSHHCHMIEHHLLPHTAASRQVLLLSLPRSLLLPVLPVLPFLNVLSRQSVHLKGLR